MMQKCQWIAWRVSFGLNRFDTVDKVSPKSKDEFDKAHSTGVKAQSFFSHITLTPCASNRICEIAVISNKPSTTVTSLSRTISCAFIYYVQTASSLQIKCSKTL